MEALIDYLNSIYPLSEDLQLYLTAHLKLKQIPKNDFLLKAGNVCTLAYFIKKGLVRCFYHENKKNITRWFLCEDDFFVSLESFFLQQPALVSIQALEKSTVWYFSFEDFQYVKKTFLEFNYIQAEIVLKYNNENMKRSDSLLNHDAGKRYLYLLQTHPQFVKRVPSKFLASYLGMSEFTLSRIKRQLQK